MRCAKHLFRHRTYQSVLSWPQTLILKPFQNCHCPHSNNVCPRVSSNIQFSSIRWGILMFASQRVLNRFHYSGTYLTRSPRVGSAEKPLPVGTILHSSLRVLCTVDPWAVAEYGICHTAHGSTVNKARKLVDSVRLCQLEVVLLRRWRATPFIPYANLPPFEAV